MMPLHNISPDSLQHDGRQPASDIVDEPMAAEEYASILDLPRRLVDKVEGREEEYDPILDLPRRLVDKVEGRPVARRSRVNQGDEEEGDSINLRSSQQQVDHEEAAVGGMSKARHNGLGGGVRRRMAVNNVDVLVGHPIQGRPMAEDASNELNDPFLNNLDDRPRARSSNEVAHQDEDDTNAINVVGLGDLIANSGISEEYASILQLPKRMIDKVEGSNKSKDHQELGSLDPKPNSGVKEYASVLELPKRRIDSVEGREARHDDDRHSTGFRPSQTDHHEAGFGFTHRRRIGNKQDDIRSSSSRSSVKNKNALGLKQRKEGSIIDPIILSSLVTRVGGEEGPSKVRTNEDSGISFGGHNPNSPRHQLHVGAVEYDPTLAARYPTVIDMLSNTKESYSSDKGGSNTNNGSSGEERELPDIITNTILDAARPRGVRRLHGAEFGDGAQFDTTDADSFAKFVDAKERQNHRPNLNPEFDNGGSKLGSNDGGSGDLNHNFDFDKALSNQERKHARQRGLRGDNDGERLLGELGGTDDISGGGLRGNGVGGGEEEHAIVKCSTTAGPITMHFHREWSPNGYDRAAELFEKGYYDQSHFFRVVQHFLVQFGISYSSDTELKHFADTTIKDDPKREDLMPFREGYMSFAGSGDHSRTSQLFIAYDRAGGLGNSPWETPFGEVVNGMESVKALYSEYGDMPPWGKGPQQGPIRNQGSSYIQNNFPLLDKFETCNVMRVNSLSDVGNNGGMADDVADGGDFGANIRDGIAAGRGKDFGMIEGHDNMGREAHEMDEDEENLYGGDAKPSAKQRLTIKNFPKNKAHVDAEKKSSLSGKVALIAVFVVLALLFSRRKKSKDAEKSV